AVLADEHGRLVVAALLGEQARLLRLQRSRRPDGRQCLPERDLPGPSGLGRAGVPEPHLLQPSRSGQPLRRLAGAGHLHERGAGRLQVAQGVVMTSTVEIATEIRHFSVAVPDEALDDLRRRITATQWPERETVADASQGVPLATMQKLARHWA